MEEIMSDIITFLRDSTESESLRSEFLKTLDTSSPEELCQWMDKKGYYAALHECKNLISTRKESNKANFYTMPY